jgi:hypothetical protein
MKCTITILLFIIILPFSISACSPVMRTVTVTSPSATETTTIPPEAPNWQYAMTRLEVLPVGGFPLNVHSPPEVGHDFIMQLPVSGGIPPYTWSLIVGNLPTGLTLESAGRITGVPVSPGTWSFTIMVVDETGNSASGSIMLNVEENPDIPTVAPTVDGPGSSWVTGKHVDFIVNYPIKFLDLSADQYLVVTPMVMGNKTPWSFIAIGLPEGLTCDPTTGVIQGPTSAFADGNTRSIQVVAKDANGTDAYFSPVGFSFRAGYVVPSAPPVAVGSKGILSVSTDSGLVVSVSGIGDIGTGGASISLAPGIYTVSIRNPAANDIRWQSTVRIDSGKTTVVKTSGLR